jgi:hypothetical protein
MENAKPWPKRQGIQSPLIISPSNLDRIGIKKEETGRRPQREFLSPLEAFKDHLLTIPPSHFTLQKVRNWFGRFFVGEG